MPSAYAYPALLLLLLAHSHAVFCDCGGSYSFQWRPSNQLTNRASWLHSDVACDGDYVLFSSNGSVVALLADKMKVDVMVLPSNGVIFLDDGGGAASVLGEKGSSWQCNKRRSRENVFFNTVGGQAFYDPASWEDAPTARPKVDVERVPSEQDCVLIPTSTASDVYVDSPLRIRELNYSAKAFSLAELVRLWMTIEGQMQFKLTPELRSDVIIDGFPFQWPKIDANDWMIGDGARKRSRQSPQLGEMNSNLKEPQFSSLCRHATCQPVGAYCIRPVQLSGQCCKEQCGAVIQWRQSSLNFPAAFELTREMENEVLAEHKDVGISLMRIDEADPHPLYQLAVIPRHSSNFDEQLFCDTIDFAFKALQFEASNDTRGTPFYDLKRQCSSSAAFMNLGAFLKWLVLAVCMAGIFAYISHDQYSKNERFRSSFQRCLRASGSAAHDSGPRSSVAWSRVRGGVELIVNASRRLSLPSLTKTMPDTTADVGSTPATTTSVEYDNPVFAMPSTSETPEGDETKE